MGFLKRIMGQPKSRPKMDPTREILVMGVAHYQDALISIAGPKTKHGLNEGLDELRVMIELKREPTNAYDKNAVQCLVDGKLVGYVDRGSAAMLQDVFREREKTGLKVEVPGYIIGGWSRPGNEGKYSVRLGSPPGPNGK
jgi:hypothetical protein